MYSICGHYIIKETMVPDLNLDFTNDSEKWKKQSENGKEIILPLIRFYI